MASGTLGKAAITANSVTPVYTVPAGPLPATIAVRLLNRSKSIRNIRVAVGGVTPAEADHIEDTEIAGKGGVIERWAIVCSPGDVVTVWADGTGVIARVDGFEE